MHQAAFANCTPNPTERATTTTCTGTEVSGLIVTGDQAIVSVADDASVDGIRVSQSSTPGGYYGIESSSIAIAEGATVSGTVGIEVAASTTQSRIETSISNAGTIWGLGGIAVKGSDDASGRIASLYNASTGVIGAIRGQVGTFLNDGLIDGGSLSAYQDAGPYLRYYGQGTVQNRGIIRSSSIEATVSFTRASNPNEHVVNSGTIENRGTGAAIRGDTYPSLTNEANGIIRGDQIAITAPTIFLNNAGLVQSNSVAILADNSVNLVNTGRIVGDVRANATSPYSTSSIDNRGGTIDGDVILGAGNDVLIADVGTPLPSGQITGVLDAGGGVDTVRYMVATDTVLGEAPVLPSSFERVEYRVQGPTTLTLADTLRIFTGLTISGDDFLAAVPQQHFVNNATIETVGSAILNLDFSSRRLEIVNNGTVTARLAAPADWAVSIGWDTRFQNNGTITARGGNGVILGSGQSWTNDGSIAADGTAVLSSRQIVNNGSIRSLTGVGLALGAAEEPYSQNYGNIDGVTAGVSLFRSALSNSGTISASAGPAVLFQSYFSGRFLNEAGGVVSGGSGTAIEAAIYSDGLFVRNEGTINGDVSLLNPQSGRYATQNVFVAAPGGIVNGNIILGSGNDLFMTVLPEAGGSPYAGVSGTVIGSGKETIRYIVDRDRVAALSFGGIFSGVGYELTKNTSLTLSALQQQTSGIHFAGDGSADIDVDIAVTGEGPAIDLTAPSYLKAMQGGLPTPNALSVVSRGDIVQTQSGASYTEAAVKLSVLSSFENAGIITVRNASAYGSLSAISGSGNVLNSGTLLLDASTGISASFFGIDPYKLDIVNSGLITQMSGGRTSTAIANATSLINSGLIDVSGPAVYMAQPSYDQPSMIRNSGTIRSRSDVAISAALATLVNEAAGTIEGALGRPAVGINGTIDNAGVIFGDVYLFSNSSYGSTYIDRGGTLTGNLSFGEGDDLLIRGAGNASGVSGRIDGGAGTDSLVSLYSASGSVDASDSTSVPINFEAFGYAAVGADTVLTITSSAARLGYSPIFLGDGRIVNQASIGSSNNPYARNSVRLGATSDTPGLPNAVAFVNEASLADGVIGTARSFVNEGEVGSASLAQAVFLGAADTTDFNFFNKGTIVGGFGVTLYDGSFGHQLDTAIVRNQGQINGGLNAYLRAKDFVFENSGIINSAKDNDGTPIPLQIEIGDVRYFPMLGMNADRAVIANSGTIDGGVQVRATADVLRFENSGELTKGANGVAVEISTEAASSLVEGQWQYVDQGSVVFDNKGRIGGTVAIDAVARSVSAANSGSILIESTPDRFPHVSKAAQSITSDATGDSAISFNNSGSVAQNNAGHHAVDMAVEGEGKANLTVVNTGSIAANGGGVFLRDPFDSDGSGPLYLATATALNVVANRTVPGSSIEISNAAGGNLSATGRATAISGAVPVGLENAGSTALFASADAVYIVNQGTISGLAGGHISADVYAFGLPAQRTETFLAGAIQTENSVDTVINSSTGIITGSIHLGAQDDRLENAGRIEGDVYLGTGNDTVVIGTGATFLGVVQGDDGADRIEFDTHSTYAAPTIIDGAHFSGVEQLVNTAGVNAYSGFLTADVTVNGGYLFGRTDSALTGNVLVASGARFGSAGTVTGNVTVTSGGQLAPGASPGTMAVNGNVTLDPGSISIFELAPAGASDRLLVNGGLIIAPGAVLELTGAQALRPGITYDLISATTLTGRFETIIQSGAIQGIVRNAGDGIGLTATLVAPSSSSTQADAVVNAVNSLIATGQASPALIAGLPSLLGSDGRANVQAISRLSGEAYASSLQLGIEHGLAIVRAGRSGLWTNVPEAGGSFTFAQAIGAWRTFRENGKAGTARATSRSDGILGGIGFARQGSAVAAFVGYVDGHQTLSALDTRSNVHDVVFGFTGRLASGPFSLSVLFANDLGKARMDRRIFGSSATSNYRTRSSTFDISASYDLNLEGWTARPHVGVGRISTRNGAARETGGNGLGLVTKAARLTASFLDGAIMLRGDRVIKGSVQPWLDLGVRHWLTGTGGATQVTFLDGAASLSSLGADRERTQATVATGLDARVTEQLRVVVSYNGEFGGSDGHSVNAGLRYAF